MTKYSFIYPIRNRCNLLKRGLESLRALNYDKDLFEVIIADYMSEDNIIEIIHQFRGELNIKYLCIDFRRYKYHKLYFKAGKCNPCLAQNIASRASSGEYLILTSPEIIHYRENLKILDSIENLSNKFIYGRVIEKSEESVFGINYPFSEINKMDSPLVLCDWETKVKSVTQYFIGVIPKKIYMNYGGIDEYYMTGIAYEDEDFGNRMNNIDNFELLYDKRICGIHLIHDRSYQDPATIESNRIYMEEKKNKGWKNSLIANKDIKFGDFDCLIEKTQMWRY